MIYAFHFNEYEAKCNTMVYALRFKQCARVKQGCYLCMP